MEATDKAVLTALLDDLSTNLQDLSRILALLRAVEVLSEYNEQAIKAEATSYEKNKALIDCLMKKRGALRPFLDSVIKTNQNSIYETIINHPKYQPAERQRSAQQEVNHAWEWIDPEPVGFPQQGCVLVRDIPGLERQELIHTDAYACVALWMHPRGEAVFGCAWKQSGQIKARFTWDLQVWNEQDMRDFKILKFCDESAARKCRWVIAKLADKRALFTVDGYTPAVVVVGNQATIGKAVFDPEENNIWTAFSENGKESFYENEEFLNKCFLLTLPREALKST